MEAVATAGVEVVVQNLINFLKEEYSLLRGLDKDAEQLQETLEMIQAYLSDAEKKSTTDAVKIWLKELEAVAFDAYYVLDELNYHFLHKKVRKMDAPNPKLKNKVLSCLSSCSSTRISRRFKMAHTIKHINVKFESANKDAAQLGLQNILLNALPAVVDISPETDSFSLDPVFIGRANAVTELVDMLTQEEKRKFSIVAIVGMGGMGKTTLTKKVFNHERVKDRFRSLLWVHVSQTFDPINLFKKIHYKLTKRASDGVESKDDILEKLQDALKDKTYLLVLDDVWNEDVQEWEGFMNSISGVTSTMGNGIIISTRSQKVASTVKPFHIHSINGLSDEDCWSIIKAKAFDGNGVVRPEFETIGKEIAKRCGGLPLAANVVGGVLHHKPIEEWHLINEKDLQGGEGVENIQKILKLSFDYLPLQSLKKCFAYCSIYPKGYGILKLKLIEQWMGEGFLQPSQGDDMESVGDMFFNVLLQNTLLQVSEKYEYGEVFYVMHDLVHDLASSVLSYNADHRTPVRYMFLEGESSHVSKEVAKHLRTLILKGGTSGINFSDFQCLHNLSIVLGVQLPNSVRELIHLRNLDLSNTFIKDLPEWIGELSHLQTLRPFRASYLKLPNTLKYLVNLRHLYIEYSVGLPAEIGRLTCLQTLPYFKVGEEKGYHIEELGSLKNLKGRLAITNLERVRDKEEALKANILQKQHLSELQFEWGRYSSGERNDRNDESVLEGLQPHANLKNLSILGYKGKRFPTWLQGEPRGSCSPLHNLISIKLERCSECEEITWNHLASLRLLYISGLESLKCLSTRFFYNHRNLSCLSIAECDMLEALPDGLDTLNSLEELRIESCRNLKSIGNPSCGGVYQGILRDLTIKDCGELGELPHQMLESWAPTIELLVLVGLRSLTNPPMLIDCLAKLSHLENLKIRGVPKLMSASVESWDLISLKYLTIDVSVEWSKETSVAINDTLNGMLEGCCNSLEFLTLRGVENWEWLPQSIQRLTSLGVLKLENIGIEELQQWFGNLSSLVRLRLHGCTKLRCLHSVDKLKLLTKLEEIEIKNCPELSIDPEWRNHPNLKITVDGDRI